MSDRWFVPGAFATIGVTVVVAVAQAGERTERISLAPNAPRVAASAALAGDRLEVTVRGLPPRARVEAAIDRLACAQRGYGRRAVGDALADASGAARLTLPHAVTERARDGWHVLALGIEGRTIACGSLPALRPGAGPAPPRHWGIWSFARRFID